MAPFVVGRRPSVVALERALEEIFNTGYRIGENIQQAPFGLLLRLNHAFAHKFRTRNQDACGAAQVDDDEIRADVKSNTPIAQAQLHYTTDDGPWQEARGRHRCPRLHR